MKRLKDGTLESKISRFLFNYRITPHSVTGISPAELLMKRRPTSRLDLCFPNVVSVVEKKQQQQKEVHDTNSRQRTFIEGEEVYVRKFNNSGQDSWREAVVEKITGPVSVQVKLSDGRIWRRHVDHVRRRQARPAETEQPTWEDGVSVSTSVPVPVPVPAVVRTDSSSAVTGQEQSMSQAAAEPPGGTVESTNITMSEEHPEPTASGHEGSSASRNVSVAATPNVRRSARTRQAPDYYGFGKKKGSKKGGV